MARKSITRYTLRYGVVAGLPTGGVLVALAAWQGIPLLLASLVLVLLAVFTVPFLVGVTDTGIETASAGAEGGFMSGSDANKYQPDQLHIPDRLAVVCWLSGVGAVGLAGLVAFS